MSKDSISVANNDNNQPFCSQAGFLPVPLRSVPIESLANLKIYLLTQGKYSLYNAQDLHFGLRDLQRLLDARVEYVYVSVKDHQTYYKTLEGAIASIVSDPAIQQEKKTEILYATSIELANQLLEAPPGKEEIKRTANLARATVDLIMKDRTAFGGLYEIFNHDFYTATHLVNVCGLTVALAQKMGLVDSQILYQIGTGGLLHDVGKIFIAPDILNTTQPLATSQHEIIKTHVHLGYQHLKKVSNLSPAVLAVVAEHHERIDGSGYPKGLRNKEISLLGQLAGVVDTFDAMTSVRPYRAYTFSIGQALQQIEDDTPQKFDREIVRAFFSLIEKTVQRNAGYETSNGNRPDEIPLISAAGAKLQDTQYYFRIPITVRKLGKVRDKLTVGSERKLIGHKITCLNMGFLSDILFKPDENIYLSNPQLTAIGMGKLVAIVTRCFNHQDGWYTIEAQFLKPLAPAILEKIKTITSVREVSILEVS
jgi:HD-GYP domain-containing protein (c-di-GMP phosphodiesterase class II)